MPYMRGLTERGIDFENGTFFLAKPNDEGQAFLDKNFDRASEGRYKPRRASISEAIPAFFESIMSGAAAPDVVAKRKESCFGTVTGAGVSAPCPMLIRTTTGSYCSACRCGRWLLADLEGKLAPKLGWKTLTCPLRRPGFSNAAPEPSASGSREVPS